MVKDELPKVVVVATYDLCLIVVSVVVALIGFYTALYPIKRVTIVQRLARSLWLPGGAIAISFGICLMHSIGMLVDRLPPSITYNPLNCLLLDGSGYDRRNYSVRHQR